MKKHSFQLTAISIALLSANSALSTGNTTEIDTVEVVASSDSTSTEKRKSYTTSAMKTTTGLELSPKETPQSVSVITKTQLDDQGITSLPEALKTTTGINVTHDAGVMRFQSRGFNIERIEEDGISTSLPGSSGNVVREAYLMTDLAVYDHIEVVRGATGLTQDNGEPGGTVNAVRKKPTVTPQIQGEVSVNRWGTLRAVANASGSLNQDNSLTGRLVAVGENKNSFRDNVDGSTGLIYGVVEKTLGDSSKLTVGGLYQRTNETPEVYGVAMGKDSQSSPLDRSTYLGASWNGHLQRKVNLFTDLEHFLNDDWKLDLKLNYVHTNADRRTGYIGNSSTAYTGLSAGDLLNTNGQLRYRNNNTQFNTKLNLNGKYHLLGREHDLFLGYAYNYQDSKSHRRDFALAGSYDPFTFNGDLVEPDWDGATPRYEMFYGTKKIANAFTFGTRFNPLDSLHLIAGTRYTMYKAHSYTDWSIYNYAVDNDPTSTSEIDKKRFSPYFGITYDLNENQSLYASYTSIYEPTTVTDKQGKLLKPVEGSNTEVGWKTSYFDGRLNTSLAAFHIYQRNRSVSVQDPDTLKWYNEPIGRVRSIGWEAEVSGRLTDNWELFAGYTYNRSKYLEAENTTTRTKGMNFSLHTPVHMFRLYTKYRLPFAPKWSVGGGVSAQSHTDSLYKVKQGGYAIWNANVQYEINKNMMLSLIGTNLTDKRYFENNRVRTQGINNFYGEPRSFVFKFNWNF